MAFCEKVRCDGNFKDAAENRDGKRSKRVDFSGRNYPGGCRNCSWGGCTFVYSTHIRCQHASSMEWYLCIGTDWNLYDPVVGSGADSFEVR